MNADKEPLPKVQYSMLRALQLEGRYPDAMAGAWVVTWARLAFGEGLPLETDPDYALEHLEGGALPPVPSIPRNRRYPQIFRSYRRLRSSQSVERYLKRTEGQGAVIGVPLSPGWLKPPRGIIAMPRSEQVLYDQTHCVALRNVFPNVRHFRFPNSWGDWGDQGSGYLPYDYFDRYVFECFVVDLKKNVLVESDRKQTLLPFGTSRTFLRRVVTRTEEENRLYTFTIESASEDRFGWAMVTEREGWLDVEELYVRPEFRGGGLGTVLLEAVDTLRSKKNLPVRLFIHWPESEREDRAAYELACKIASKLGCTFEPCHDPRAAYIAVQGGGGTYYPPTPHPYPTRPTAPLKELLVLSAMLIIETGMPLIADAAGVSKAPPIVGYSQTDLETFREALDAINPERWTLIAKKNRGGLTAEEQSRLDDLQEKARILADQLAPVEMSGQEEIATLLSRFGARPS